MADCLVAYQRMPFSIEIFLVQDNKHKACDQRIGRSFFLFLLLDFTRRRCGLLRSNKRELIWLRRQFSRQRFACRRMLAA